MSIPPILPIELLLIICNMIIEDSIQPQELCRALTYPNFNDQLRSIWETPPRIHPWLRNLRLVCRTFHALIKSPYFLMRWASNAIGSSARFVHVPHDVDLVSLRSFLEDPSRFYRITALDIQGSEDPLVVPTLFSILCEYSHSLSNVRSLTLGFQHENGSKSIMDNFWPRLSATFPLLACLVIRGAAAPSSVLFSDRGGTIPMLTFQKLEMLDMDRLYTHSNIHLPSLRHAAFRTLSFYDVTTMDFPACANLESLILRRILRSDPQFEWINYPKLQLLCIPAINTEPFMPLPPDLPLRQLRLSISNVAVPRGIPKRQPSDWLAQTIYDWPTVTQLTLAFRREEVGRERWMTGNFSKEEVGGLGFKVDHEASGVWGGAERLVLERVLV